MVIENARFIFPHSTSYWDVDDLKCEILKALANAGVFWDGYRR
jgi:hypothetical protein